MSLQDVLEMANELSQEDRHLLRAHLNEQSAADFSSAEIKEIRHAIAEADVEFKRGEGIPAKQFFREMGL